MYKFLVILFILFFAAITTPDISSAAGVPGYTPLSPIPGLTGDIQSGTTAGKSSLGFAEYLRALYIWGVAAASGLAVVMIMWGGVGYMTSAGGGGVEEAKNRIQSAIMGLLLALGSYVILSTVNKNLLNLEFGLGTLNVGVNKNAEVIIQETRSNSGNSQRSGSSNASTNSGSPSSSRGNTTGTDSVMQQQGNAVTNDRNLNNPSSGDLPLPQSNSLSPGQQGASLLLPAIN